jgi:hypothetical protein
MSAAAEFDLLAKATPLSATPNSAAVRWLRLHLLWRHVEERPERHAFAGEPGISGSAGDPKISELHPPIGSDQDVRGFDVAVHDSPTVNITRSFQDLLSEPGCPSRVDFPPACANAAKIPPRIP